LCIDLDRVEANAAAMAHWCATRGVTLRPHAKSHKCVELAQLQRRLGASGVCAATVSEAWALVQGGVDDVLLTGSFAPHPARLQMLAQAVGLARLAVVVDDASLLAPLATQVVPALQQARPGTALEVLVELEVGQGRGGVDGPAAALALAQRIATTPGLRFAGVQPYQGGCQQWPLPAREQAVAVAAQRTRAVLAALAAGGLPASRVTGAGTGSVGLEVGHGLLTEVQPGSYLVGDRCYWAAERAVGDCAWHPACWVESTVLLAEGTRVVVDAGHKSHALDSGPPLVVDGAFAALPGVVWGNGGDEHGLLRPDPATGPWPGFRVGQRVRWLPGHCDPTFNLHDWVVAVRGAAGLQPWVEAVWPVVARGCSV
jgi:D-serine deaminase-like pyridoxal phosphate-dependent protein